MKYISSLLPFLSCLSLICNAPTHNEPSAENNLNPVVEKSTVYPYGLKYQLHANSPSVNIPPHSSYLMEPIGTTGRNNHFSVPDIQQPGDFSETRYFDADAADEGDGTIDKPYNSLKVIMDMTYPDDCALLLKAGSIFYLSSLHAGPEQQNIYFGSYGKGAMPVVTNTDNLTAPETFSGISGFGGENITVNGIHIVGGGTGNYNRLVNIGGSNVTFADCHFESILTPGTGYLYNIFKGGAENMTIYHCEIAFARDDIWYASSKGSYTIVSNYFHHANMGVFNTAGFNPADRTTWQAKGGDIIQFEYENLDGAYIADNFFDKGDSAGKFALIFNGGETNKNVIVECNTFICPMNVFGGAAVQWHTSGILRNNLFLNTDPEGGVSALASYKVFTTEIAENHFVGYTENSAFWNISFSDLAEENSIFSDLKNYTDSLSPDNRVGSSIFNATQ